ncbi:MAG: DUF3796 domain-containing protein [bacterium]
MRKRHGLWVMGFLGLLGLLGLVTDNPGFYGFFGFFGFFGYARLLSDERLRENINAAAKNAFICTVVIYPLANVYAALNGNYQMVYTVAFALNFGISVLVFALSVVFYER